MAIVFNADGAAVCTKCGACLPGYPKNNACNCASRRPGLGDMVAAGLDAIGVTKERVQAVASAVGVKDCGCAKRQAALNRLGEKLGLPPGQAS